MSSREEVFVTHVPPENKLRSSVCDSVSQAGVGNGVPVDTKGKWGTSLCYSMGGFVG